MTTTSFDQFVLREHKGSQLPEDQLVNWSAKRDEWLRQLSLLYDLIGEYLETYIDQGQISIKFQPITLNEEFIGPYSTQEMIITIGSKTIKLEPVGANILLAHGRVDVIGPLARAQLLLLDGKTQYISQLLHTSKIDLGWRILTRPPYNSMDLLNKENFLNLLLEVSNG